jgi:hypothetical protein
MALPSLLSHNSTHCAAHFVAQLWRQLCGVSPLGPSAVGPRLGVLEKDTSKRLRNCDTSRESNPLCIVKNTHFNSCHHRHDILSS